MPLDIQECLLALLPAYKRNIPFFRMHEFEKKKNSLFCREKKKETFCCYRINNTPTSTRPFKIRMVYISYMRRKHTHTHTLPCYRCAYVQNTETLRITDMCLFLCRMGTRQIKQVNKMTENIWIWLSYLFRLNWINFLKVFLNLPVCDAVIAIVIFNCFTPTF